MKSARKLMLALMATVALLGLAACSSIPLAGPVGTLAQKTGTVNDEVSPVKAYGPSAGDDAADIVGGFLNAGVDSTQDYEVARQYLTKELALSWNATVRSRVVTDQIPTATPISGDSRWRSSVRVVETIDANGVRTRLPSVASQDLVFTLERVDGEWKISDAPDGIVVEQKNVDKVFTPVTLYFYADESGSVAVPDLRWIARRKGRPTTVVTALMAGPAPYLRGAVVSWFPEGSELSKTSVPVNDGVAVVDLPKDLASKLNDQQRRRVAQQLRLSLQDVGQVQQVQLTVEDRAIDLGSPEQQPAEPKINPGVDSTLVGVRGGRIVTAKNVDDQDTSSVPGGNSLPRGVIAPALAVSGNGVAALNADSTTLLAVGEGGKVTTLLKGEHLHAPSYDSRGWVWTAEDAVGAGMQAVRAAGGKVRSLAPAWMATLTVLNAKVSLDGTRLAMVVEDDFGEYTVLISGIVRDSSGEPVSLAEPMRLASSVKPTRVLWDSDRSVVAYAPSATDMLAAETIDLDGTANPWRQKLRGVTQVAVPAGAELPTLGQTADGVFERESTTWSGTDLALRDLAYRG